MLYSWPRRSPAIRARAFAAKASFATHDPRKPYGDKLQYAITQFFQAQRDRIQRGDVDWQAEEDELEKVIVPCLVDAALAAGQAVDRQREDPAAWHVRALKWANAHAKELARDITRNTRDAVAQIPGEKAAPGAILASILSAGRALLIGVTETVGAWGQGQRAALPEAKYQWHTAEDEIVCEICEPLDGRVRRRGDAFGRDDRGHDIYQEPGHPNCRCVTTPYVED